MVLEFNDEGVDDNNTLLNHKRWDVYVNVKGKFVKGGYSVEVVGHDSKKVLWEVADDNVIEEATDTDKIGLWGFNFNVLAKTRRR